MDVNLDALTPEKVKEMENSLMEKNKEGIRQSVLLAAQTDADRYAEATRIGKSVNVPPEFVESDLDRYRNDQKLDDATAGKIVSSYPDLQRYLNDPDNAKLMHDDIPAIVSVLDTGRSLFTKGLVGQFLGSGIKGVGETAQSASDVLRIERQKNPALTNSLMGLELTTALAGKVLPIFGGGLETAGEVLDTPKERRGINTDIASGAGQVLGGIGLAILSGGSSIPAMGMYFGQSAEGQTEGLDKAGVNDPYKRLAVQVAGGAVTAATEKVQLGLLMKGGGKLVDVLKGTKGMEKVMENLPKALQNKYAGITLGIGGAAIGEAAQETMDNFLQDAIAYAAYNPDVEFFKEWQKVAGVSGATGAIARSLVMAVAGVKHAGGAMTDDEEKKISKENALKMAESIKATKLNGRSPEKMREIIKQGIPDGAMATLDATVLNQFFQSGVDPERFFEMVPDARTQFDNAELSGSDISIPYDEFVYAIANAPVPNAYDFMADFIKTDRDIDPELQGWDFKDPEQINAFIQKAVEQSRADFENKYQQDESPALVEQIERRMRDTLMNADVMGEKVRNAATAADEAKTLAEYLKTRLSKAGKGAEDTFLKRLSEENFMVTGPRLQVPKMVGTGDAYFDRLRDKVKQRKISAEKGQKARAGKADLLGNVKEKRDTATLTPLINALSKRGKINRSSPIAKELSNMGIDGEKYPRLFTSKGGLKSLDNIPVDDIESDLGVSGIFSRDADLNGYASQQEILDKLRDETFGNYIRTDEQIAKDNQDDYDNQILDELDRQGIDIETATADEINAALDKARAEFSNADGVTYNEFDKYGYKNEYSLFSNNDGHYRLRRKDTSPNGDIVERELYDDGIWYSSTDAIPSGVSPLLYSKNQAEDAIYAYKKEQMQSGDTFYQNGMANTDSEAFKKWFGDSKVVDADGNPLVVYHGTTAEFEAFDPATIGKNFGYDNVGFFFTDSERSARSYSMTDAERADPYFRMGKEGRAIADARTVKAYVSIKKPITMKDVSSDQRYVHKQYFDPIDFYDDNRSIISDLAATGEYDGVLFKIQGEQLIAPFSPTQIKSVNNRGTFDANDPRILYQSAFHGSPHRFDKFFLDHIGSGEGNQSFGWGLYFTGDRDIAEFYRESLSYKSIPIDVSDGLAQAVRNHYSKYGAKDTKRWARETAEISDGEISKIDAWVDENENSPKGQVYEVKIPDDDVLIDFEKSLVDQSTKVKDGLEKLGIKDDRKLPVIKNSSVDFIVKKALRIDPNPYNVGMIVDNERALYERGLSTMEKTGVDHDESAVGEFIEKEAKDYLDILKERYDLTGDKIYNQLSDKLGGDKEASIALNSVGIKGNKYPSGTITGQGQGASNYVIFDDNAIETIKTYYQNNRGQNDNYAVTKFFDDGKTLIGLFEGANRTSLMHEMGHLFLDLDAQIAAHPDTPQAFKDEFNATLAWLGIEKYSDAQAKHHEKFARGFEAYLYNGETTNPELKDVFQRMKLWFISIYKSIKELGVKIDPEMKGVFDRLLATDEAIEAQKSDKLFDMDKATLEMLNPKQRDEFIKQNEQAFERMKDKLFRKAYRQKLREKTDWWKEESEKVQAEVEDELSAMPVYQAIIRLQDGEDKLNKSMVIKAIDAGNTISPIGKFEIKYLPKGIMSDKGTIDPDIISDLYGFQSTSAMFQAIKEAGSYKIAVQKAVENRMIERHGDMLNDGTIDKEALDMAMQEVTKSSEVVLQALSEKTGVLYPSDGDFKKAARIAISQLKIDHAITPDKYYRAALKASKEYGNALGKKDFKVAADAKRREMLNKYLYTEAKNAREETNKALDMFKRLDKKPPKGNARAVKIDPTYHEKIWDLLDKYNFNPKMSESKRNNLLRKSQFIRMAQLQAWMDGEEQSSDASLMLPPELLKADGITHYRDMTLNEFRGLRDLIDNLETQGRRKREYIVEGQKKDLEDVTREMVETADKHTNPIDHPLSQDRSFLARVGSGLLGIDAVATKIQQICVKLDGGDNYGIWTRSVYEPIQRAVINKNIRMRTEGEKVKALMDKYYKGDRKSLKDVIVERGKQSISRENLISFALHFTATEDNRKKLVDFYEKKYGFNESFMREALGNMREKDWNFVMGVRDLYESYWPETSAIEKSRFGYAPEKLEALPDEEFITIEGNKITVRGGYARIMYDSRLSYRTTDNDLKDAFKELTIGKGSVVATKRGSMIERVSTTNQGIRLDFDVIGDHVAEQVGIITMSEAVENAAKVMRQNNVQKVLHENLGAEYKMVMDLWLQDIAVGEGTSAQINGNWMRKARTNYTVGKLALKPLTSILQLSGIVQTASDPDLGIKYTLKGLTKFMAQNPIETSRQIREKSKFMSERKFTLTRDAAEALNEYTRVGKTVGNKTSALMLLPMQKMQAVTDMVTWLGAYEFAIDKGMTEADAVRYSDLSVSRLQGSGLASDLAAIERGTVSSKVQRSEIVKAGTVMYSYFNAKYNIIKNAKYKYDNKQITGVDFASTIVLSILVEGFVSAFLMGQLDWDDEEDGLSIGDVTVGLGSLIFYQASGAVPYARTMASSMQGFTPQDALTAQISALGKLAGAVIKDTDDLITDEKNLEDINWESRLKRTVDAIGVFIAIPSSQIKVIIGALAKEDAELMDYLVYRE